MTRKAKKKQITQGPRTLSPPPLVKLMPPRRWGVGIGDLKAAITAAESLDAPRRARLLDIYDDILLDAHLSALVEKRRAGVTSAPVAFLRPDGRADPRMDDALRSPWFSQFLRDALDARFFGFSLFQFDTDADGWPACRLVRRKHVDPLRRVVLAEQGDAAGAPFDDFYGLVMVGDPYDLGLLAKAAKYVIYKGGTLADWAEFAEVFGMPVREYTYDATDDQARLRLLDDARAQGAAQVYIHPEGTQMRLVESAGRSGSLDVYRGLADFCNAELSKLFLGNTLTTEASDTGTQALGAVQKRGEDMILRSDRQWVLDVLNYQLADVLASLGLPARGGRFAYQETEDFDPDRQLRVVQGLHAMGLDIDEGYLFEKFGVERAKGGGGQEGGPEASPPGGGGGAAAARDDKGQLAAWERFFASGGGRKA